MCDSAVEGKGGGERGALLFAERGEVWIGERVVCCVEVVVALCVANEMQCRFAHCCYSLLLSYFLYLLLLDLSALLRTMVVALKKRWDGGVGVGSIRNFYLENSQ